MTKPKQWGGMGFRDMKLFYSALLARQAWRILQDPTSLSERILKAVYFEEVEFLEAEVGGSPSQIWRAIAEGKEVLKQGLVRRIGTGEDTHICRMNWLPRDGLLRPLPSTRTNPPLKVSELIDPTMASWDQQKLQMFLTPMDVEVICNIPLSMRRQQDFWAWHYERGGSYGPFGIQNVSERQATDEGLAGGQIQHI